VQWRKTISRVNIGFIPDGNRRWAVDHGLPKEAGYAAGINTGVVLFERCKNAGLKALPIYCFNSGQHERLHSEHASAMPALAFAFEIERRGAALLVVGDEKPRRNSPERFKRIPASARSAELVKIYWSSLWVGWNPGPL